MNFSYSWSALWGSKSDAIAHDVSQLVKHFVTDFMCIVAVVQSILYGFEYPSFTTIRRWFSSLIFWECSQYVHGPEHQWSSQRVQLLAALIYRLGSLLTTWLMISYWFIIIAHVVPPRALRGTLSEICLPRGRTVCLAWWAKRFCRSRREVQTNHLFFITWRLWSQLVVTIKLNLQFVLPDDTGSLIVLFICPCLVLNLSRVYIASVAVRRVFFWAANKCSMIWWDHTIL